MICDCEIHKCYHINMKLRLFWFISSSKLKDERKKLKRKTKNTLTERKQSNNVKKDNELFCDKLACESNRTKCKNPKYFTLISILRFQLLFYNRFNVDFIDFCSLSPINKVHFFFLKKKNIK